MIEVYAFLAMFLVQILAMSVLFPFRVIKYARAAQATSVPDERLARLYPGLDHKLATERFLTRLRVGSTAVAAIGLFLLGWLFNYLQRPDWTQTTVGTLLGGFYVLQYLPLLLGGLFAYRLFKSHEQPLDEGKRKATLERRGLFDFVSPSIVFLAALAYIAFVALVLFTQQKPFPGFWLIGFLTLVYALQAFDVYRAIYGKKKLIETRSSRALRIGFAVKFGVYICILNAVFFVSVFSIDLLDLKKWVPFSVSALFVAIALLISSGLTRLMRRSASQGLGPSSEVPS